MELKGEVLEKLKEDLAKSKTVEDLLGKDGAIKKLLKRTIEAMLEEEATEHLGYEKHSPAGDHRGNSRNGTSQKTVQTQHGAVALDIPRDRQGSFEPQVVKKHQRTLGLIEDKIVSLYAKGMSTRDIQAHVEEIYGLELSASAISHITDKVIELVEEWQNRPLEELYVVVYFDAIHYKVRQEGKVVTKAAYTCLAVDREGDRDLLGLWIGEAEGSAFWLTVFTELRNRGVQDILIACVDGLKGLSEAIHTVFPATEVQLCIIHQVRHALRYIASKDRKEVTSAMRAIYQAPTENEGQQALKAMEQQWATKYPMVIRSWKTNWPQLSTFFRYPQELKRMIYTTNAVEALHRQFRKVTKTKASFPHDDALRKILYLAYADLSKDWNGPVSNWSYIVGHLSILFNERFSLGH